MIARAKTSRPRKSVKKKAVKVAKPAKAAARSTVRPAKAAARSTVRPAKRPVKRAGKKAAKKVAVSRAKKTVAPKPKSSTRQSIVQVVTQALDDMKAVDVTVLDVRNRTDIADTLIVASGTSDRHVRSIAQRVVENAKKAGFRPMGVEGEREGEWILVDLQDLIIHIMLPRVREFYRLENLWDVSVAHRETVASAS